MFTLPERIFALRIMKYSYVWSLEVTFTTRIMKYQHFRPPGTSFCSTYNEILTYLLSGADFYYTYNEISTYRWNSGVGTAPHANYSFQEASKGAVEHCVAW